MNSRIRNKRKKRIREQIWDAAISSTKPEYDEIDRLWYEYVKVEYPHLNISRKELKRLHTLFIEKYFTGMEFATFLKWQLTELKFRFDELKAEEYGFHVDKYSSQRRWVRFHGKLKDADKIELLKEFGFKNVEIIPDNDFLFVKAWY